MSLGLMNTFLFTRIQRSGTPRLDSVPTTPKGVQG